MFEFLAHPTGIVRTGIDGVNSNSSPSKLARGCHSKPLCGSFAGCVCYLTRKRQRAREIDNSTTPWDPMPTPRIFCGHQESSSSIHGHVPVKLGCANF